MNNSFVASGDGEVASKVSEPLIHDYELVATVTSKTMTNNLMN